MCIDQLSVKNLMDTINSNIPQKSATNQDILSEKSKYDFGSVWHGDFYSNTEWGQFGSNKKKNHYGLITDRRKRLILKPTRHMAPITSKKKNGKRILKLPPGELKTYKAKQSYILLSCKLLMRKSVLDHSCEFIQRLSDQYIDETIRIMNNG